MNLTLINPADPPERQREKLLSICAVLMRRVEAITDDSGAAYAQFQRAALLEDQVRDRTLDLERALDLLNDSNARLALAMRETEAARADLASAIEAVQEGFALFDAGGAMVMCNSRFARQLTDITGLLRPGLRFADYIVAVSRSVHLALPPGETPETWATARWLRHGDPHVIFNVALTGDRWLQVSEHRTPQGGTVILQTDVTDIMRMEREARGRLLDDQARMIRATLDHLSQGVAIFGPGAELVGWNRRLPGLLGLPVSRLRTGARFAPLFDPVWSAFTPGGGLTRRRLETWAAGPGGRAALSFRLSRGAAQVLEAFAEEMPDGGFVISFSDVTAERAAIAGLSRANETLEARVRERTMALEDALADAERANAGRSRFVAAASHDLLQPLSAAKLFLSSIDGAGLPPPDRAALDKAQNALVSVEGILGALLDISKLEGGKAALRVGPVRLDRMLAQLADEFAPVAAAKGLGLRIRPSPAVVQSDATYLRRILQNLIGNALRYTARGRVVVAARPRGGMIRLEVWDTGPGIPEAEQDAIFREFHRLNAQASASEGMGLGLAIVDRACGLLGHPLGLVSRMGRGTCFMVQAPLAAPSPAEAALPPPGPLADPLRGRVVLLIENEADLRGAIVRLLERWGCEVIEAAGGEEALALLGEIGILPDAVLADQHLGAGLTGLQTLAALRAAHGPVPARLVTADRTVRARAASEGVAVLTKPIDPAALEVFLRAPAAPALTTIGR